MNLKFIKNEKTKNKFIIILINIIFVIFMFFIVLRLTWIGQAIDSVFNFIFGFLIKYFFYILIIFSWIQFLLNKKKYFLFNKKKILKIIWFSINLFWLTGWISIIFLTEFNLKYQAYSFENIFNLFFDKNEFWKFSNRFYELNFKEIISLRNIGGFISLIISTIFNYLYFMISIILNIFSFFLMFNYFIYNHPFFLFLKKEKKDLIKWNNIKNGTINTNFNFETMNQIKDENITIEVPIIYKMSEKEKNIVKNIKTVKNQHENIIKQKLEEKTIEFEWEIPEISSNKKEEILEFSNFKQINKKENTIKNTKLNNNFDNLNNIYPNKNIFQEPNNNFKKIYEQNKEIAKINKLKIKNVFKTYSVNALINSFDIGPIITKFEIFLNKGVKVQKFLDLKKEFEIELAEKNIRIEAPIPGKSAVGIEIPNKYKTTINWKPLLNNLIKKENSLQLLIGKNVSGKTKILELQKIPHLLIAGSTGSGKSICLLSIISSLIYRNTPDELKLLLIDPKKVELSIFSKIPHLVSPIIIENKLAIFALREVLKEIKERYKKFNESNVNKIDDFNKENPDKKIPYFVIIIDELADLIFTYRKEIENIIVKIAQIARAAGVFLIIATQRSSINVVTGLIKVNIPGRIAFKVVSNGDSRTILNQGGAEKLLGHGDMLILDPNNQILERVQGVFINKKDIQPIVDFWIKKNYKNIFWKNFENINIKNNIFSNEKTNELNFADKEIYNKILLFLIHREYISISLIQRKFSIGFNRAAKIVEKLEEQEIIIKSGSKYKILKN